MKMNAKRASGITNVWLYSLYIGFFAGLIWGGVKLIQYGMKFTEVIPGFLLEPFFLRSFLVSWPGLGLGYASFILLSMTAALLYGLLLRNKQGPWPGIGYGLLWWVFLYLLVGPWMGLMPAASELSVQSFVSDLCLFAVWGLFIGYSIAMEFTDERRREPRGTEA